MMWVVSLIIAAAIQAGPPAPAVRTLDKGQESAIDASRQVTARTPAEWATLWKAHSWDREMPKVDFAKDMVVGVFMGSQPTAGYGVEIVGTHQDGGALVVDYRVTRPARDAMTAQILTAPYHLAAVPKFGGEVRFKPVADK
jgi:hypothetical protein